MCEQVDDDQDIFAGLDDDDIFRDPNEAANTTTEQTAVTKKTAAVCNVDAAGRARPTTEGGTHTTRGFVPLCVWLTQGGDKESAEEQRRRAKLRQVEVDVMKLQVELEKRGRWDGQVPCTAVAGLHPPICGRTYGMHLRRA